MRQRTGWDVGYRGAPQRGLRDHPHPAPRKAGGAAHPPGSRRRRGVPAARGLTGLLQGQASSQLESTRSSETERRAGSELASTGAQASPFHPPPAPIPSCRSSTADLPNRSNPMTIAPIINCLHPELDSRQRQVIGHTEGPMLFIAGPGAGKTRSMQLRAVNLILRSATWQ